MSLIANYHQLQKDLERLQSEHNRLSSDPALKREMEFDTKLRSLMGEYSKSLPDIMSILEPGSSQSPKMGKSGAPIKHRRKRLAKTYRNPLTGEIVESKGGNNKLLGQWKAQFGSEEVEGWVQSS